MTSNAKTSKFQVVATKFISHLDHYHSNILSVNGFHCFSIWIMAFRRVFVFLCFFPCMRTYFVPTFNKIIIIWNRIRMNYDLWTIVLYILVFVRNSIFVFIDAHSRLVRFWFSPLFVNRTSLGHEALAKNED